MEHVVGAPASGAGSQRSLVAEGDTVRRRRAARRPRAPRRGRARSRPPTTSSDLDHVRPDLAEVLHRHAVGLDEARPDMVARRRATGPAHGPGERRGPVRPGHVRRVRAAGHRRPAPPPVARGPDRADAGRRAGRPASAPSTATCSTTTARAASIMSYDYTVLAGTQGLQNHRKKDRLFELAERWRLPVVFFTEGGGGRPGDTDAAAGVAGLDCMAFHLWGRLSGLVPLVGITSGRCFAGNAALLGCCDVVIATADSNIGMGGPAMIEGGGLGVYRPEEVGPMAVQVPSRRGGRGGRRTRPRRSPRPSATSRTSRARWRHGRPPTSACCARSSPRTGSASTTSAGSSTRWSTPAPCSSCGAGFGVGMVTVAGPDRGPPDGHRRQRPDPPRRRHRHRRRRTRRPGSCSCATPSTCPCSSCATRRG